MTDRVEIIGIDHVQLAMPTGGESAARRFYGELLGLREVPKPPELSPRGGCWFIGAGGTAVHLGVDQRFMAAKKGHPCLIVADLGGARRALETAGSRVVDDDLGRARPSVLRRGSVRQPDRARRGDGRGLHRAALTAGIAKSVSPRSRSRPIRPRTRPPHPRPRRPHPRRLLALGDDRPSSTSTRGAWTLAMISSGSVSSVTSDGIARSRTWIVASKSTRLSIEYSIDCGR